MSAESPVPPGVVAAEGVAPEGAPPEGAPIPPEVPEPDGKDWSFVVERPCAECGFDPDSVEQWHLADLYREGGERFAAAVEREDAEERPAPQVWSVIEYGRHVADVLEVMRERLELILAEGGTGTAEFESWDGDAAALEEEYWRANGHATALLLRERAEAAAEAWSGVVGCQWDWAGVRDDGTGFTPWTLGLYLAHELVHHLHDVNG